MKETKKAPKKSFEWFRNARFGMFVHYGLYSLTGRHEWAMCYERIPSQQYVKLINRFSPKASVVDDWVRLAKSSGMRYMALTTRHHEGFALFDTKASEFNSMNSPAGRDLVAEYAKACARHGMDVGLYYSVGNWNDPGYVAGREKDPEGWKRFVAVAHAQLKELMTNYGEIKYLFYDHCPPPETWDCARINAAIRRLQPGILISRCGLDDDIKSAEGCTIGDPGQMWESCMTSNRSWGYNYGDKYWKTPREIVHDLMVCAHNGGNYILNIGPKPDGAVPAQAIRLLKKVGEWAGRNADALYGTDPHPFQYADQKLSTAKGNVAYIPLHYYHGPESTVAGIGNQVKAVRLLATGQSVSFRQEGNRVLLTGLPRKAPDPLMTVMAFELDGKPFGIGNPLLRQTELPLP